MGILASKHLIVFVLEDDLSDSAGPIHSLKEKPLAAKCFVIFRFGDTRKSLVLRMV
jgi:hypothetical protein